MRHDVFTEEWLEEAYKKKGKGSDVRSHARVGNNAAMEKPHPTSSPVGAEKQNRHGRAGSNPAPSPLISKNAKYAPYKNKLEHSFALTLGGRKHAGQIRDWAYESQTLKLAQGKYHRPDFLIWHLDGTIEIAQTKGYHKNMRASLTGIAWAAQRNPWFRFTVWRYKNGWSYEEVRP